MPRKKKEPVSEEVSVPVEETVEEVAVPVRPQKPKNVNIGSVR